MFRETDCLLFSFRYSRLAKAPEFISNAEVLGLNVLDSTACGLWTFDLTLLELSTVIVTLELLPSFL